MTKAISEPYPMTSPKRHENAKHYFSVWSKTALIFSIALFEIRCVFSDILLMGNIG